MVITICHPLPTHPHPPSPIPGLGKILPAWQAQSELIWGWVGGWGWGDLGWVISQQRWSDGRAGNVRYWWLQFTATPLPILPPPPDRLSTLHPYLQPPSIPSPWPGSSSKKKGGGRLMAKRLPRERERGEGLRSHPLFLLGWQNWYNYCIIENGRDSQRFIYPILIGHCFVC